jgi:4-aminobutyrate aminotransferase
MHTTAVNLLAPVWTHMTHFQPVRGEGAYLYDESGTRFLDFTSGIGVTNTGHCHPRVVKAIQEQAAQLIFGQMNIVIPPAAVALAETLDEVTPASLDSYFFSNSGAEAVEGAVKLARHATGRRNIIVFQGSFHGRTAQAMAMTTAKTVYRYDYQPLPGGVFVAPFPYCYASGMDEDMITRICLHQLDLLFRGQSAPDETAAIVIEPVLGEGGYVPAPLEFLRALREICTEHEIMFAADEVQTGFGRTGRFFAVEHAGIEPDILIMAKGLGSGMPISAIASRREFTEQWKPGTHGGTYGGGNAVAAAAARETINVLRDEDLVTNAARMGQHLTDGLVALKEKHPAIGDVRGPGLMVGVEFSGPDRRADKATTKAVQQGCIKRGMLLLTCGTYENVIRWIPPLIVTEAQIDEALGIFEEALVEASVGSVVK